MERLEIGRVTNIMSGIFLQMIGDEWLGIEAGWEEVKKLSLEPFCIFATFDDCKLPR